MYHCISRIKRHFRWHRKNMTRQSYCPVVTVFRIISVLKTSFILKWLDQSGTFLTRIMKLINFSWIYGRVIATGQPFRLQHYNSPAESLIENSIHSLWKVLNRNHGDSINFIRVSHRGNTCKIKMVYISSLILTKNHAT